MKTIVVVTTTNGSGNHLLAELFVVFGFKQISPNPMVFWPLYIKARREPQKICTNPGVLGSSYAEKRPGKNRETFDKLCRSWGYSADSRDLMSVDEAVTLFREIVFDCIEDDRLVILHDFEYIHPLTSTNGGKGLFEWSQDEADDAFRLLLRSLNQPTSRLKFLCFLRRPSSIYHSMKERFSDQQDDEERVARIVGYFDRIGEIRDREDLDRLVVKYEDLCTKPRECLEEVQGWLGLGEDRQAIADALLIVQPLWEKILPAPESSNGKTLAEIARRYGYDSEREALMSRPLMQYSRRVIHDLNLVKKAFAGNLRSSSAIFRHRFSLPARCIMGLTRLLPGLRNRWMSLMMEQERLGLEGTTAQPELFKL